MWSTLKQTKLVIILSVILLVLVNVWFLGRINNDAKAFRYIGKPTSSRDVITISGEGKVTAIPDIAVIQVGVTTEKPDVRTAQKENSDKMNVLTARVKALGVGEKDIQTTQYSIYPQYDYADGKQRLRGYQVAQSVKIKIRDLSKIGALLAAAGEAGANQVSGVSFTIDDPEALRQQAREKALDNARAKADALARRAGVKLGKIVSFSEGSGGMSPVPYYARAEAMGIGGGSDMKAPDIQPGDLDVIVGVDVSYEIL